MAECLARLGLSNGSAFVAQVEASPEVAASLLAMCTRQDTSL